MAETPKSLWNFHKSHLHLCLAQRGSIQYIFLYLPYTQKSLAASFMYFHSNSLLCIFLFQTHTASWWTRNEYSNVSTKKISHAKEPRGQWNIKSEELCPLCPKPSSPRLPATPGKGRGTQPATHRSSPQRPDLHVITQFICTKPNKQW